jgi:molybdate transport repressor ModE-like protein
MLRAPEGAAMTGISVFIRLDLPDGNRIGPGKIALLEAIRAKGSITAAARHLGMAYRTAWLLVQEINNTLQQPAVTTTQGGPNGSGAAVSIELNRSAIVDEKLTDSLTVLINVAVK